MFIEEAPPSPPRAPTPPTAPAAGTAGMLQVWNLQRQLRTALGSMAQEVQVVPQPDRTLLVKVRVDNGAVEKQATEKLLRMPEIANPQVRLQILVSH
jgi:hypothetical protein